MKKKLSVSLIFIVLFAACGRSALRRDQKTYETVEEGSATGVTSTIQGPGETLPPITGTNADGTTAFALDPNAVSTAMPATMTSDAAMPPMTSATPASVPIATVAKPKPPESHPVNPTRTPEPAPPARTDTTATEATQPPPQTDPTKAPPPEDPPAEATATEEPPPPPAN